MESGSPQETKPKPTVILLVYLGVAISMFLGSILIGFLVIQSDRQGASVGSTAVNNKP